jgi:hypothetical protein
VVSSPRPPPSFDATFARLVLDAAAESATPRLRMDAAALRRDGANRVSASAQFSGRGWADLHAQIAGTSPARIVVVDLRKESHGFLNGAAVSWYATNNWGCVGLTRGEAQSLESVRLKLLAGAAETVVATKDDVKSSRVGGESWPVSQVLDERALVEASGARYLRIPIDDHCGPEEDVVAELVRVASEIDASTHVHVHCRGGKGRTSTALAILDMVRGADGTSLEALAARRATIDGYDLAKAPDAGAAKAPYIRARWEMLARVHAAT